MAAFEQASAIAQGESFPLVAAAESSRAAGRRDKAIAYYQRALAVVNAMKAPRGSAIRHLRRIDLAVGRTEAAGRR